jgi:beta-N-acetylhexosaminidase
MVTILGFGFAAVVAGLTFVIDDPVVFPIRSTVVVMLVTAAGVAATLALVTRRRLLAALLITAAGTVAWHGAQTWRDRAFVLRRTDAAALTVERRFVVGYGLPVVGRELALDGRVGGLFLTRRNVQGRSAADVSTWVAGLQAARRSAGLPALVVAADQEGGPVSHLSPPLPAPPALSTLRTLPDPSRHAAAERVGAEQGAALHTIGVTLDLAPVSDLMPDRLPGSLDWHTRIATRAISDDPAVVADVAAGFAQGLHDAGVVPTAKHFPGLGRVTADTHIFSASLAAAQADLDRTDWLPFRAVLAVPGAALMLSHVALDSLDPGVPASRSRRLVDGLLRRTWGFDGITITDDLTMGAVVHSGLCAAVEGALNAGIDLLLVSWDTDKVYPAMRCAIEAMDAGRLDPATMASSARRIEVLAAATSRRESAASLASH